MNPQIQSVLTSIGLALSSSIAAWAVSKGYLPGADQSSFASDLVTLGSGVVVLVLGWLKTRQVTQTAMIKAVNAADNGVTAVSTTDAKAAGIPPVNAPLK